MAISVKGLKIVKRKNGRRGEEEKRRRGEGERGEEKRVTRNAQGEG